MATVDRSSPLPAYFQVALAIRRRIEDGEWAVGERIPPELALARSFAVSRVTVRQALAELVKDDLLERKRGSGTYVRPQPRPLHYDLSLTLGAYASHIRDLGMSNRAEVLEAARLHGPAPAVRDVLGLEDDAVVVTLLRRILINDVPAALYRSWFDARAVPGIELAPGLSASLSQVLEEDYDAVPVRAEHELEVIRPLEEEASLLGSTHDVPLVVVTSTTYLEGGRPLEHSRMTWLGDRVRFHVTSDVGSARS